MRNIFLALLVLISCASFSQQKDHYGNYGWRDSSKFFKQAQYQGNYGSTFNIRSHVDKGYTDSADALRALKSITITINGIAYDLSANRSWSVTSADSSIFATRHRVDSLLAALASGSITNVGNGDTALVDLGGGNTAIKSDSLYNSDGTATVTKTITSTMRKYDFKANIASGTYAATLTGISNVATSSAVSDFTYSRTGDVVTFSGAIIITATATSTLTELEVTLPVASSFTSSGNLSGTVNSDTVFGYVYANTANAKARIAFTSPGTGSPGAVRFICQYKVTPP